MERAVADPRPIIQRLSFLRCFSVNPIIWVLGCAGQSKSAVYCRIIAHRCDLADIRDKFSGEDNLRSSLRARLPASLRQRLLIARRDISQSEITELGETLSASRRQQYGVGRSMHDALLE